MSTGWSRRIVPAALGTAMLAILVAAALSPNTGAIPAQSNCTYGTCPSSTTPFPWWIVALVVALVVVALVALLVVMRRRRPPTSGSSMTPWSGGTSPPPGANPPTGPPSAAPAAASPAYLETAEDVGHAPPAVSVPTVAAGAGAGAAAGAGAGAAAGEGEPDIDSLMAELDKISGEILKRAPKKGSGSNSTPPPEDEE